MQKFAQQSSCTEKSASQNLVIIRLMGNSASRNTHHVFNNTCSDVFLYALDEKQSDTSQGFLACHELDFKNLTTSQSLIGTIPSKSSKSLCIPKLKDPLILLVSGGRGYIRTLPSPEPRRRSRGDRSISALVVENDLSSHSHLALVPFCLYEHVELPSVIMNLDTILPYQAKPRGLRPSLSRSISYMDEPTSVETPNGESSSSQLRETLTVQIACKLAAHVDSWRYSGTSLSLSLIPFAEAIESPSFRVLLNAREDACSIQFGGVVAEIPITHSFNLPPFSTCKDSDIPSLLTLACDQAYIKLVSAARFVLPMSGDIVTTPDLLRIARDHKDDLTIVTAASIVLNDLMSSRV